MSLRNGYLFPLHKRHCIISVLIHFGTSLPSSARTSVVLHLSSGGVTHRWPRLIWTYLLISAYFGTSLGLSKAAKTRSEERIHKSISGPLFQRLSIAQRQAIFASDMTCNAFICWICAIMLVRALLQW